MPLLTKAGRKLKFDRIIKRTIDLVFYFMIFAIVIIGINSFLISSFKIPSDSMEPTLLIGDNIIVSKITPGPRIYNIINAVHKKVNIKRINIKHIKRNDIIVFNYPYAESWEHINFNIMKFYIKRCIGLPGDTLSIQDGYYSINGVSDVIGNQEGQREIGNLRKEHLEKAHLYYTYPEDSTLSWNVHNFGDLYIPKRNDILTMNRENAILYHKIIEWEQSVELEIDSLDRVLLNGEQIHQYKFQQNYYFVTGDFIINSQDSRYWGLLPEEFIIGKAWFIWKSIDPESRNMRWDRVLKSIN